MKYTTITDCISSEIIAPIENSGIASREEFDIDSIADALIKTDEDYKFYVDTDAAEFWECVQANAL